MDVINPYTEQVELSVPEASAHDIERIVANAREAFETWRATDIAQRVTICQRFMDVFQQHRNQIARDVTRQVGKPLAQSQNEINGVLERTEYMMSIAEETLSDDILPDKPGFVRTIRHEPKGVVLDIAAWNYPLMIAVNVVVPGVLAGDAVIIKHSNKTPLCASAFADAFAEAGAPEHLVQAAVMDHATSEALIRHPGVDHISFTGSVRGGHEVAASASGRFIDVGLELGGKDPAYVCADVPVEWAAEQCVDGAFYNAGQSCCAIERIYVDEAVYDQFVEAFAAYVRRYRMGDPMDDATTLGPLASRTAPQFLQEQVGDAVAGGGKLLVDPNAFEQPRTGWFAAPAVVADAPQSCRLMQEESFGPVIGIRPVRNEAEAVRLMNDSPYGLTASIWTKDVDRAHRIGPQIATGTLFMNRCDYLDPALPWVGVKDTGRGVTLSRYGFYELTRLKSIHLRTEMP